MCKLFKKPVKKQSINQNNKEKEDFIMKINLFNIEEFIDINKLQEVTSPILFQRGDIPHPNGLISNQIFGITVKSSGLYIRSSRSKYLGHLSIYALSFIRSFLTTVR